MIVWMESESVIGAAQACERAVELALECVFFEVTELTNDVFLFSIETGQGEQMSRLSDMPYRLPSNLEFDTMTMSQLCSWYVESVGYDPVEDCPDIELERVRSSCKEHALIERCGGLDLKAYQLVEAYRDS